MFTIESFDYTQDSIENLDENPATRRGGEDGGAKYFPVVYSVQGLLITKFSLVRRYSTDIILSGGEKSAINN